MLPLSPNSRRYGYLRDPHDHRDYGAYRLTAPLIIPTSMDLEKYCGPKKDQGALGACTMFAGTGNLEYLYRRFLHKDPVFSPLFGYYLERQEDGSLGEGDTGSYGRTACKVMQKYGLCLESEDHYQPSHFEVPPTDFQLAEGLKYRSGAYHRLVTVDDMKHCLASEYPFLVGFTVYESFENGNWKMMPVPSAKEQVLGGHEVLFIGYDDEKTAFKVRNSWGDSWADKGNFWFPYECAADSRVLQDAWIQHLGHAW